jgi:hypothetical protein
VPEPDLIALFVHPLEDAGIRYIISGSVAAMLYGEPRVTHDVDLVVFLRSEDIQKLPSIFPSSDFYLPPVDLISREAARDQRGHFNAIHRESGLKADFYLANRDELHAWGFRNKKGYTVGARKITLAPPEYVIVRKLEFFREGGSEKHIRDIRSMLAVSGEQIDQSALREWINRFGLQPQWAQVAAP